MILMQTISNIIIQKTRTSQNQNSLTIMISTLNKLVMGKEKVSKKIRIMLTKKMVNQLEDLMEV